MGATHGKCVLTKVMFIHKAKKMKMRYHFNNQIKLYWFLWTSSYTFFRTYHRISRFICSHLKKTNKELIKYFLNENNKFLKNCFVSLYSRTTHSFVYLFIYFWLFLFALLTSCKSPSKWFIRTHSLSLVTICEYDKTAMKTVFKSNQNFCENNIENF